jgi:hypothetical protein
MAATETIKKVKRKVLWKPFDQDWRDHDQILWVFVAALDASWKNDCCYGPQ